MAITLQLKSTSKQDQNLYNLFFNVIFKILVIINRLNGLYSKIVCTYNGAIV